MSIFLLKKYDDKKPEAVVEGSEVKTKVTEVNDKVENIKIKSNETLSSIVAHALYQAFPNRIDVVEDDGKEVDVNVISNDDINKEPVDEMNKIANESCAVIIADRFSTKKEEWFLSTLENKKVTTLVSMESLISYLKDKLSEV